jgi:bidirectional [NiFe] hydrogenase diaphorase subunit
MTPEKLSSLQAQEQAAQAQGSATLRVCMAAGCASCGSAGVRDALRAEIKRQGVSCAVKGVGCMGLCQAGPLVEVSADMSRAEPAHLYRAVAPEDAPDLVASVGASPVARLTLDAQQPFFSRQHKIVLENCGAIDPERIEDYIAADGYQALARALTALSPAEIIDQISRSGLRGRGGAGFSTGMKWATVAKAPGDRKYLVCNADEGDPGAFMDRSVLESDPHRVLEGMLIAAYAIGADTGFIYVRAEYPLAIRCLKIAIKQAERLGLLGQNILESGFNFHIEMRLGAGAFVCGEETALIASVHGGRGQPRPRPPFPAERGLWGRPTLINNVETYANVPAILRHGPEWYADIGTEKSKGTKVFALAGSVRNTGLVEVPMGITLREIIFDIGGGIPNDRAFKAVQTGGPSGGCIPADYLDLPVDYETLVKLGSFMGSGGMIVIDDTACMVDVARFFMEFCMTESCGKCVPCRAGTVQMYHLLTKIASGEANLNDLAKLEALADMVKRTSLCGLGQGAPNPVLSTLRYFRHEYLRHIHEHVCPAGVCKMTGMAEVGIAGVKTEDGGQVAARSRTRTAG